jgi:hypothetical protein
MSLGSGIRDPGSGKNLFRIPDPGVKKAPDPGSGSATLLVALNFCCSAKECLALKKAMKWKKLLPAGLQKVTITRNISQGPSHVHPVPTFSKNIFSKFTTNFQIAKLKNMYRKFRLRIFYNFRILFLLSQSFLIILQNFDENTLFSVGEHFFVVKNINCYF